MPKCTAAAFKSLSEKLDVGKRLFARSIPASSRESNCVMIEEVSDMFCSFVLFFYDLLGFFFAKKKTKNKKTKCEKTKKQKTKNKNELRKCQKKKKTMT